MTRRGLYTEMSESDAEVPRLRQTSTSRSLESRDVQKALLPAAPSILIVEDDPQLAIGLMNVLEDWQIPTVQGRCKVHIATNVERALSYLNNGEIDIYLVDLILDMAQPNRRIGAEFIRDIITQTNAGIIILTSLSASDAEAAELLNQGADDFIQKPADVDIIRARVSALWRRIQYVRPAMRGMLAHNSRTYFLGDWRFVIGNRLLTNSLGETVKLSPTEHAFLRHICVDENHKCDVVEFNVNILGRRSHEESMRVDNLVYRLRNKLRGNLELVANEGTYRLLNVREVKPSAL